MIAEYQRDEGSCAFSAWFCNESQLDFRHFQTCDNNRQRSNGESLVSESEGILLKNMDEKKTIYFVENRYFDVSAHACRCLVILSRLHVLFEYDQNVKRGLTVDIC